MAEELKKELNEQELDSVAGGVNAGGAFGNAVGVKPGGANGGPAGVKPGGITGQKVGIKPGGADGVKKITNTGTKAPM